MLRASALASALLLLGVTSGTSRANPASLVPSAGVPDRHVLFDLEYRYELDSATVAREDVGVGADPLGPIARTNDLAFNQFRHVLTPRADIGVFRDTWVSLALPITIKQARELTLADGIMRDQSTTLRDGLLPMGGFDARDPNTPPAGDMVFRGVSRAGLDQLHLGFGVAPMNQERDDTKPTWKIRAELLLAIGKTMKFDALDPSSETGVSRGVHEVRVGTSFDKRYRWTEAWFELFWQRPIAIKSDSLFSNPGYGATNTLPSQLAGISAGLELYAVNDKVTGNKISFEVGGRTLAHFEGREYTEMWEVFAHAGDSRGTGPLILDRDPLDNGLQAMNHPGITNVENYLETTGRFALRAALGNNVRFGAIVDLTWKTDHAISFADAGVDLPTCGTASGACETDDNDLVDPGSQEVNPLHAETIDLVGHRYLSQDNFAFSIGVQGLVMF
ncbi:MAG: hypothetical protein SFX73_16740 [Kofleriaceae bacterium]|nr:hypothetical protein [Kofleriaceae bacterium]